MVLSADQSIDVRTDAPPMNHIIVFDRKVNVLISPVDYLPGRINASPQLFLLLSEVNGKTFVSSDVIVLHPRNNGRAITPAVVHDLIASEVSIIISKSRIDIAENV